MAANDYKAYTLSVDDIKRAKVENGERAIAIQIVRLILMEPGVNPLFPGMGVGIVSLCVGKTEDDLEAISSVINNQISTYLPTYRFADVELEISDDTNHTLIINISINGTIYVYDTAKTETPITIGDLK